MRLRIDELATRTGTTSRTIRAYQAKGLLPPPEIEGRTGYYGEEHVRRLQLIDELQERGFSLQAIRQTLDTWAQGGGLANLVGFSHVVAAPFLQEEPLLLDASELAERFPEVADRPELVARAAELGLIEPHGDGRVAAPSPLLLDAGTELVRAGIPLAAVLDLVVRIRPLIDGIAQGFVGLVDDHLTAPLVDEEADAEQVTQVVRSIERLRPIALEVIRPFLARSLRTAIDDTVRERVPGLPADDVSS